MPSDLIAMSVRSVLRNIPRRLHIFTTAVLVYACLKTTDFFLRHFSLPAALVTCIWNAVHIWCARRLLSLALSRRGFWVKCCQYVASRSDVLPDPYITILSRCLDACPPDPPHVILDTVANEIRPRTVQDVFEQFDPSSPIACASIAQVHTATLKENGTRVVLKVQHPDVRTFLMQDLCDLKTILNYVGAAEPDFDLRPMMDAWIEMVPNETNFLQEIANVKRVRSLFRDAPKELATIAAVPRPIEQLSTESLFVMEYVDGCKLSDYDALDRLDVDRERLVTEITKSFALQLHISGNFNGDPHPGTFTHKQAAWSLLIPNNHFGIANLVPVNLRVCAPIRSTAFAKT